MNKVNSTFIQFFPAYKRRLARETLNDILFGDEKQMNAISEHTIEFPLKVVGIYGKGSYAIILQLEDARSITFAARVGSMDGPNVGEQLAINNFLARYEMAPRVYLTDIRADIYIFVMDPIQYVISDKLNSMSVDLLYEGLVCLLGKKYLLNFLHGDMHTANIAVLNDGTTLGFIDFDFSIMDSHPAVTFLDFVPLLKSIQDDEKRASLSTKLIKYYEEMFKVKIDSGRIMSLPRGGYGYIPAGFPAPRKIDISTTINSYIKALPGLIKKPADVFKYFPTLVLPRVVE